MSFTAPESRPSQGRWNRQDGLRIAAMAMFVLLLHAVGWGTLLGLVVPGHYWLGSHGVFGVGLGATAYLLGARHAFDADHIAAIDNTTRKLAAEGRRPVSVGFWFALGHSSVVFVMCLLLGLGMRSLAGQMGNDASGLQAVTGLVGTAVSGVFLLIIGLVNAASLVGIVRVARRMRVGRGGEQELERHLQRRGVLAWILRGTTRAVSRPWHMYPVGLLFGLGFDTVTEVSLLVLAGGAAVFALPWYAVATLPVLFAAGMSLLDAADGVLMTAAYEWAFLNPVRKVFYNLTVTALSVLVALGIGGVELVGLLSEEFGVERGPLAWLAGWDMDYVGYGVVAVFVLVWLVALAYWKLARVESRWGAVRVGEAAAGDSERGG